MSLVLTLRLGHDFYIEQTRCFVSRVYSSVKFAVRCNGSEPVVLDDQDWVEVEPGVRMRAGIPQDQTGSIIRVAIEAPGKKILRGELYRKEKRPPAKRKCETCKGTGLLRQRVPHDTCSGHGCSKCRDGYVVEVFGCPDCGDDEHDDVG